MTSMSLQRTANKNVTKSMLTLNSSNPDGTQDGVSMTDPRPPYFINFAFILQNAATSAASFFSIVQSKFRVQ